MRFGDKEFFWWNGTGKRASQEEIEEADEALREWLAEQSVKEERVKVGNGEVVRLS